MRIYLRFTGIASLLIGLHLFTTKIVLPAVELSQVNNISSHQSFVASNTNSSSQMKQIADFNQEFEPQDNGGPDTTRGSGTR